MNHKILVVGNWKMHPSYPSEAKKIWEFGARAAAKAKHVQAVACTPFPYLTQFANKKHIALGAQNVFYEKEGAFTGEVSATMLKNFGVEYCIVGHSERRALGESDEEVAKKVLALLKSQIIPIVCVGERERTAGHDYLHIVRDQLHKSLKGIPKAALAHIVIAYEPVWALSTTENRHDAMPEDSLEMTIYIRRVLSDMFKHASSIKDLRIIYGGSVTYKNIESFLRYGGVAGVLPGRDSLDPIHFAKMIQIAETI